MDLEQYLRQNKPETPDEGQFLIETNARLDQVEGIKQTVDAEHRRGRKVLVIALVGGLVLGSLLTLFALFYPVPSVEQGLSVLAEAAAALRGWKVYLLLPVAVCAVALGVLSMTRKKSVL